MTSWTAKIWRIWCSVPGSVLEDQTTRSDTCCFNHGRAQTTKTSSNETPFLMVKSKFPVKNHRFLESQTPLLNINSNKLSRPLPWAKWMDQTLSKTLSNSIFLGPEHPYLAANLASYFGRASICEADFPRRQIFQVEREHERLRLACHGGPHQTVGRPGWQGQNFWPLWGKTPWIPDPNIT